VERRDMKAEIICVNENTTNKLYGECTDKAILITKNKNAILLTSEDLKELERVMGCKFTGK
jgi:DNA-binding transcriptional regulator YhcF (GntR family)